MEDSTPTTLPGSPVVPGTGVTAAFLSTPEGSDWASVPADVDDASAVAVAAEPAAGRGVSSAA